MINPLFFAAGGYASPAAMLAEPCVAYYGEDRIFRLKKPFLRRYLADSARGVLCLGAEVPFRGLSPDRDCTQKLQKGFQRSMLFLLACPELDIPPLPPGARPPPFHSILPPRRVFLHAMDAHLFRRFCEDLTPLLVGARVEKLQEPAPGVLALTFFSAGRKRQLCLRFGRKDPFCFVTEHRLSVGRAPSAPVMRLRKLAAGRRVAACVSLWCQRQLWLLLAGGPQTSQAAFSAEDADSANESAEGSAHPSAPRLTWLLLDLREGPSLRFLAEDEFPEDERPVWPEPAQLADALENWRQWPVLSPALRRTLARLDEPEQWALLEDLRVGGGDVFCYGPVAANAAQDDTAHDVAIRAASAWPLPQELQERLLSAEESGSAVGELSGADVLALTERAGQHLVLSRLAEEQAREAAQPLDKRGRKLARLLDKLREEESRLTAMTAMQADALALQAELWRWPSDFRASSVSVQEGEGPERKIALDPRRTVREEMARLFHAARRGQRGLEHLAERRVSLEAELAALGQARRDSLLGVPGSGLPEPGATGNNGRQGLPSGLPKNVQLFVSSDGFALLRGRDSRGNLAARKLAAPHDIWLHAENGPGSHVIIRRAHGGQEVPARTLDEAGSLAANKSWQRDAARARVQYAEVRHVKPMRNAPAGTVRIDKSLPSREVPVVPELEEQLLPR